MITMVLNIILFMDAFICSLGKNADVIFEVIISYGIHLGVDNGLKLFDIIRNESIGLSVYLMLLWYGLIVYLVYYYFTLDRTSSTARRLYGFATLSSFACILWSILSLVPVKFQLCFLFVCVIFCWLSVVLYSEHNFQLLTSRLRSCGKIVCVLCQIIIPGFELYMIYWGPFHLGYILKCVCHSIVFVHYGNHSYQLSLLLGVIGSLDVILRSVGRKAKSMHKLLKLAAAISLVPDILPFIIELENGQKNGDVYHYLKTSCILAGVTYVLDLAMLEDTIVNHRLVGAGFLFALSRLCWKITTGQNLWFRVCGVCIPVLWIALRAMVGSRESTVPAGQVEQ